MASSPSSDLLPLEAQIKEVARELKKREEVFPRWVEAGKLTKAEADHRIVCMRAVLDTLTRYELARLEGRVP